MKLGFKAKDIPQDKGRKGFNPIPEGEYTVLVEQLIPHDTRSGGKGLKARYQVVDGQYRGRLIFDFINVVNDNPQTEAIGHKTLRNLAYSCGLPDVPDDTVEYINNVARMVVGVKRDDYKSNMEGVDVFKNTVNEILFDKGAVPVVEASESKPVAAQHAEQEVVPVPEDDLPF